jgi:predicted HD phosphohydrolase
MPALHDLAHLAKRFAGALLAQPLTNDEQHWVLRHLVPGEQQLWHRMSVADQRHAIGVAQRVEAKLGHDATRPVLAAALLHDIGKIESDLGTLGRSAATVLANANIKTARVARYRSHNEIGRRLLIEAGSDTFTATWAYEHELPASSWTVDRRLADVLHEADDD